MYAGAVASIVSAGIEAAAVNWFKNRIQKTNTGLTANELTTFAHVFIGAVIAGGLISAALWLWMAQSCGAGKNWARITSTVFFALSTVFTLSGLANSVSTSTSTSTTVGGVTNTTSTSTGFAFGAVGVVVWLIGLAAIIFLWQRSSSDYFSSRSRPRY